MDKIELVEWGNNCKAWFLLNKQNICVVREEMPPESTEVMHFHQEAEQYFFVFSGKLSLVINNDVHILEEKQGIYIPKGTPHKVFNQSDKNVEFILFSSANPRNDRVDVGRKEETESSFLTNVSQPT